MSGAHPWFGVQKQIGRLPPTGGRTLVVLGRLAVINNRMGKGLGRPNIDPVKLPMGLEVCGRSFAALPPIRAGGVPRKAREV